MGNWIEKKCVERGLRMTEQRKIIAQVLSDSNDHPDAEELYARAAKLDDNISLATVYRTVRLFLIDVTTGEVIEFVDEEIEELQKRIAAKLGYELVDHRLELYGKKVK